MNAYEFGSTIAFNKHNLEKTALLPEEYRAAGNIGTLGGAALGAAGGAGLGNLIAKHLGKATRSQVLGIPIPGTGTGESLFGKDTGPVTGELIGSVGGGLLGGAMGNQLAELKTLRRAQPPMDPRLLQYFLGK